MALEEKKREQILQKLLNPYLVMIIDEETFEEQAQLRTSRLKMFPTALVQTNAMLSPLSYDETSASSHVHRLLKR